MLFRSHLSTSLNLPNFKPLPRVSSSCFLVPQGTRVDKFQSTNLSNNLTQLLSLSSFVSLRNRHPRSPLKQKQEQEGLGGSRRSKSVRGRGAPPEARQTEVLSLSKLRTIRNQDAKLGGKWRTPHPIPSSALPHPSSSSSSFPQPHVLLEFRNF